MKKSILSLQFLAVSLGLAVAGITQQASAVDATWAGASGAGQDWQTATNWSSNPAIPHSAGDKATFANTLSANTTVLLNGAVTLGSLTNLDTNNEINIQNGTGGSITFDTGSATVPTIDVSARTGGVGILLYATVLGSNGLKITGSTTTAIRVNSTNTDWAGFSGGLTITQGILAPQAGNYNYNTFAVTADKVLPTDERLTLGTSGTTDFQLSSGRDLAVGSLDGTSNASVYNTSAGASFAVLAVGNDNTSGAVFAGTIGAKGDGTNANMLHLHKIGSGTQEISGKVSGTGNVLVLGGTLFLSNSANNNDYTGTTTINSGTTLKIGSANALGATGASSGTTVNSGGTLDLNGQTTGETLSISGTGLGGAGALINSNTGAAATVSIDIPGSTSFSVGGAGDITLQRVGSGNAGQFTLTKIGLGTVTTSGSGHNNLMALVVNAGTFVLANSSGYGADRGVTINGGTLKLSGLNFDLINDSQAFTMTGGVFDLNGKNEAVASIVGSAGATIRNGLAATTSTLYVGGGSGGSSSGAFAGVIENGAGTLNLAKEGTGTQTLTGSNTYSGTTTISKGTLMVGNGGMTGSISGTSGVNNNGTLAYNRSDSLTVSYSISGSGAVNQIGAGTTILTGNNTYSGTTTISSGTWKVNGLHTGAGAYEVQSGATLGGSGTITTAGNAGITLDAGGKLSPGNSPGTLTADLGGGVFDISAGVNATNSQSLLFDLTTTAASDRVLLSNASSTFNIGTGVLEFDDFVFTTGVGFGPGIYTLFDSSHTITGTLGSSLTGILSGLNATISFANSNQDIVLAVTAVPEPAICGALAGLALTGLSLTSVIRRRSKRMAA